MQEELLQFKLQKVWVLVDLPKGKRVIGTRWIFKNKNRSRIGINKWYQSKEQGKATKIKAIRLFLAYASFMGFMVYQMDVKSAFLYGRIEEEVYVCQPPGFKDPEYPDKVYKVMKALYGLHQAPRAWYETLANYLFDNGFQRGKIDQTLFIKRKKGDILLVQIYIEDIIFGYRRKYEILRKYNNKDVKTASTLVDLEKPLVIDGDANDVDVHLYRSMIGSLMYLTASQPDIIYLKGKPTLGLWYSRNSPFELVAYTDSDYARATQDRKLTTRGCQFLRNRLISWQCKKQTVVATSTIEAEYMAATSYCGQALWIQNQMLDYGYNFMNTMIHIDNNNLLTKGFDAGSLLVNTAKHIEYMMLKGFLLKHVLRGGLACEYVVGDEAVHKELGDRMERAATTASSLEAEQDNGSSPRCQDTILGGANAQTRFEIASNQTNDPHLSRGHTLGSGEASLQLMKLMSNYTTLSEYTASLSTTEDRVQAITTTIDGREKTIVEASLRTHLKLEDFEGLTSLPNAKIFEQLTYMGYEINSDNLTFQKGYFSP
ncbi:putative ribonuclease H-like domain-containing protein [Tanacetum coccineum]